MTIRCALVAVLLVAGCGDWLADDVSYVNYFTGETCSPNPLTFQAADADHQSNGNVSPTGIPGDNMDDLRSGKVDCLYDGNSGQGDDLHKKDKDRGSRDSGFAKGEPYPDSPSNKDGMKKPWQKRKKHLKDMKKHRKGLWKKRRAFLMKQFDANKDGKLGSDERSAIRNRWKEQRSTRLQKYDANGDGQLGKGERHRARAEWIKAHPKSGERWKQRRDRSKELRKNRKDSFKDKRKNWRKHSKERRKHIKKAQRFKKNNPGMKNKIQKQSGAKKRIKSNNGVRDHGKGLGRKGAGQGKGSGRGPAKRSGGGRK